MEYTFQTTVVGQFKTKMKVFYTGTQQFTEIENLNITPNTVFLDCVWKHAELYINPEISGGEKD